MVQDGWTALHMAALEGHKEVVAALLATGGVALASIRDKVRRWCAWPFAVFVGLWMESTERSRGLHVVGIGVCCRRGIACV